MISSCAYFVLLWLTCAQGGKMYSSLLSQLVYKPHPTVNAYLVGDYGPYFNLLRENIRSAEFPIPNNPTRQIGTLLHNHRLAILQSASSGTVPAKAFWQYLIKPIKINDDLASDLGIAILELEKQNDTAGITAKTEELVKIFQHRLYQTSAKIGAMYLVAMPKLMKASVAVFAENILIPSRIDWVPRPTNFFVKDDTIDNVRNPYGDAYNCVLGLQFGLQSIHSRPNSELADILWRVLDKRLQTQYNLTKDAMTGGIVFQVLSAWQRELLTAIWDYDIRHMKNIVTLRWPFSRYEFGIELAQLWKEIKSLWERFPVADPDTEKIIGKLQSGYPPEFFVFLKQDLNRYVWIKEVADCAAVTKNAEFQKFLRQSEGPADLQRKMIHLQRKIRHGVSLMMYQLGRELFTQRVFPFAKEYSLIFPPPPAFTNGSWSASLGWEYALNMLVGFEDHLRKIKTFRGWTNATLELAWTFENYQEDIIILLNGSSVELQMKIEDGPSDMHALMMDDLEVEIRARDPSLNSQFQRLLSCYRINLQHPGYSRFKADIKAFLFVSTGWTAWHSFPLSAEYSPSIQTLRDGKLFLSPFTTWEMSLARGSCGSDGELVALLGGREVDMFLIIKE